MNINHAALELNWNNEDIIQNAKVLVLGSFNPFIPEGENTDNYYGRNTNYFWKEIAIILNLDEAHFFNNPQDRLIKMREYKFCCLDIINSVDINAANNNHAIELQFADENIYNGFSDQVLFTTQKNYQGTNIHLNRNYNNQIINRILDGKFHKVIHTMGNSRINQEFEANPIEHNLGINGFQGFINQIVAMQHIEFVPVSYSPSQYAVNRGGEEYRLNLRNWLIEHLELN